MAIFTNLTVFTEARSLVRAVAGISLALDAFGDLRCQIRRSALSVVSNIAEGAGSGSDKVFRRHVAIARGSVNEVHAQLLVCSDLGIIADDHPALVLADRIGRRCTALIRRLEGCG